MLGTENSFEILINLDVSLKSNWCYAEVAVVLGWGIKVAAGWGGGGAARFHPHA